MKITLEFLKKHEACEDGIYYFVENNLEGIDVVDLVSKIKGECFLWAAWLLKNLLNKKNNQLWAINSAELELPLFEKYDKKEPDQGLAIEAAKKCIENPTKENKEVADAAAAAAFAAADAYTAAYAAAYAYAAATAAADATAAAYAAYAAADAAADARKEMQDKIINKAIELFKTQEGGEGKVI